MTLRGFVPSLVTLTLGGVFFVSLSLLSRLLLASVPLSPMPRMAPEGELGYDVRDAATGKPMPAKLTFLGVDGTPDPPLTRNDIGRQEGDAIVAYNRLMSASGSGAFRLPHGTYDVYVSRGPEWDLSIQRKVRISDKPAGIRAALHHVIDSSGYLSADFHVHAACSPDSRVPMLDRVYEFLADGIGMIVSTDHNVVCDYAPIIAELGVGRYITSATGDELTTAAWGHFGAFPLPQDHDGAGHGAVHVRGRDPVAMFKDIHATYPDALISVHHPRIDSEIGYFNIGHLDSAADQANRPGFSFDFDAIELLNGYQDAERRNVDRVITDWFNLLNHGHIVSAMGNSDTHHLTYNLGGYPRNYVRVRDDRPAGMVPQLVARAVKAHRTFFTTAPFIRFSVDGGVIGDLVPVRGGKALAQIQVEAAPWVSVSSVTLYVNGQEHKRWSVVPGTALVRFKESYEFKVSRDSYVVVRVDGDKTLSPVVGDMKRFDVRPLLLTNPVFLDYNGNGMFEALNAHGPHVHQ